MSLERLLSSAHAAAQAFDRLPVSPASLAGVALDWHLDGRREIHVQPRTEPVPSESWLEVGPWILTVPGAPAWVDLACRVREWKVSRLTWRIRMAAQLASRGWCEQDAWNLDRVLCTRLSGQLESLADQMHGWPKSEEFPTPQSREEALRAAAADLRRVDGSPRTQAACDAWMAVIGDDDQERAAYTRMVDAERDDDEAVRRALRWVADHHQNLWD